MTDADTLTPTDADIMSLAYDCSALPECVTDATLLVFAHAVLAKWGAPAPASHPYAYEFSRRNEDGTHSLHIERNELQEGVLRWWERIGPPKDAITDRPIKALYETPQAHPVAAPEPHYGNGRYLGFARHNDAYSVAQVQAMFAAKTQPTTE